MAETWLTSELLEDIREQGRIPSDDPGATDVILLAQANKQLKTRFVPLFRKARSEWYVTEYDQALVANQQDYAIPSRSATNSVRSVVWFDSAGRRTDLVPATFADQHSYSTLSGRPGAYIIVDDRVRLLPKPSSALGTLRIYFEMRPSTLVLTSAAAQVTAISLVTTPGSQVITTSGTLVPATNNVVDCVRNKPPFSTIFFDKTITLGVASVCTIAITADMRTPVIGDWVCLAGETTIPQLPPELHPLLSLATAAQWLLPIDYEAATQLMADYQGRLGQLADIFSPRTQGKSIKMKSTSSMLRRSGSRSGTFDDWS